MQAARAWAAQTVMKELLAGVGGVPGTVLVVGMMAVARVKVAMDFVAVVASVMEEEMGMVEEAVFVVALAHTVVT